MFWNKEKPKNFAEESLKTRKAREKLRKELEEHQKQITPQALEKKVLEIHRWIARHASNRVVLKNKTISLFDGNQNAAKLSVRISQVAEQLQKEQGIFSVPAEKEKTGKMWSFLSGKKEEK